MTLPICHEIINAGQSNDMITLTYEERLLRRRVLTTDSNFRFLVDLPTTHAVNQHDAFCLEDGQLVGVACALEILLQITGDLTKFAWHLGNRHTPCQIETNRLLIQQNDVLQQMLEQLGATIKIVSEPFEPEIGAYGYGRTHAH